MTSATGADGSGGRASRFYRRDNDWFCSTSLQSDITIEVEGTLFHLHKFPLISKCGKIAQIIEGSKDSKDDLHTLLEGCPGGSEGFLIAAKFCYENKVELKPEDILMAHLVADFLEMTEEYREDNLLMQAENFIHKVILRSWNDCISTLQNSQNFILEAEKLPIVQKCLNAAALMACQDPSFVRKSTMYGNLQSPGGSILWNGINTGVRINNTLSDWWFEDVSSLSFPIFKKFIETINIHGIRSLNLAGALMFYARKHLHGLDRWQNRQGGGRIRTLSIDLAAIDQKILIESIVNLLPENKGKSYCRFLLGLLRLSIMLDVDRSFKELLERRIGMQLELVTLDGLLIPNFSGSDNLYDTDCVERIIRHFLSFHSLKIAPLSASSSYPAIPQSSSILSKATKLIDDYLAEVAPDANLKPQKMQSLLEVFPEYFRKLDDGIYRALDIYLKGHPQLQEKEKEKLCQAINFGKLSTDACIHASQNESLPLRAVLQVLFFEQQQLRSTLSKLNLITENENNVASNVNEIFEEFTEREGWVSVARENQYLRVDMERIQSKVRELENQFMIIKKDMRKFSRRSISR
ncbi:BTB/POZ domain-containing protein At3g44820 [Phalaenopsis equestris]|uniref:BTB/POZ domain-containing protein At3g44820 n=1 Tax=Phalaenopsis equestris TaxID=78828 RepID=UPI0009E4A64A|nr:BTB/POZ domain-containing protein At3g44820 [Phalaenopsis equestris]